MSLNFPSSPSIGQIYTDSISGFSYEWNGTVWISFSAASSSQIKPLDDISGSFDDVTQTFALTSNSVSITPPTAQSLIINLGGVIQDATDDYSVTSSNITFSTPPASGLSFSGVSLGPAIPINTIPDGTVTDGSLTVAGILSTSNLFVTGVSTFAGITTVTGTTLFTKQLNVSGVSTFTTGPVLIGSATSTGTASQPLQVTGGAYVSGSVGIGTTNPLQKLHVLGNLLVAAGSSTGQHITQKAYELNSGTISWEGSAGQLFSITNNLTSGSIFSVNDVSGIPSIDVNADGTVTIATYGGNLGIGTTNPTHKLHVLGDVRITGILTVGTGSITLNGSTNTISGITTINTTSINGGPLAGFRNAIINGNFDIWQRGTSFTASEYGADRWIHTRSGTTHTASRQAFTLGQTDVPNEPVYFCRTVVSSVAGAGNFSVLLQKLEDVRTFAGQQITVSFWAKADATKNIAVELAQVFGTGGSPSTSVLAIGVTKVSISTSWQKVTVTATVPSISGKTLGSNNNDYLQLDIWFDAGSTYDSRTDTLGQQSGTFDIAQVQIEPGPVATTFERRPIGTELALCQRYFEKSYSISIVPGTASSGPGVFGTRCSSSNELGTISFKQSKRVNPSIILYNWSTGATGTWRDGSGATDKTVTAGSIGESSFAFDVTSSVDGNQILGHWIASAEL